MTRDPDLNFTTLEDLLEEDSLRDEPSGSSRCHCGRFAHLKSAPVMNAFGVEEWQVRCGAHGLVWVS